MTSEDRAGQQKKIRFWCESAERDRETAKSLLQLKRYDWSLFIYHLALEKLLKALVVQSEQTPPPTHNLKRLATMAGIKLTAEQQKQLDEITDFNIEARYDDDKLSFYKRADADYAATWHTVCDELYLWLTTQLNQK